jgi:hypothetical protein
MGANVWFWLIYVLTFIFGAWGVSPYGQGNTWAPWGGWFVLFILTGLLGLRVFGSPIS